MPKPSKSALVDWASHFVLQTLFFPVSVFNKYNLKMLRKSLRKEEETTQFTLPTAEDAEKLRPVI
jgi:hypothetical protein